MPQPSAARPAVRRRHPPPAPVAATAGARMGMRAGRRGASSMIGAGRLLANQFSRAIVPMTSRPIGAGPAIGIGTLAAQEDAWRFAQPDAGGPFRRQLPVLRRGDRRRADGDARGAEALHHDRRGAA
jgi:hypothetical protein